MINVVNINNHLYTIESVQGIMYVYVLIILKHITDTRIPSYSPFSYDHFLIRL